ncbi:MAG: hypothetical protein RRA94_01460 [Bacteroidota bacterium]|nr:hypothetical protein [Bacteroidota bacterium]
MRLSKNLFLIVGVASVILLGAAIFFRPAPEPHALPETERAPEEELRFFLDDSMDYDVKLSRILAERRIDRTKQLGIAHPELADLAREVADSLRARLERRARIE